MLHRPQTCSAPSVAVHRATIRTLFRAALPLSVVAGIFFSVATGAAVTITDADYEGRAHFKVETRNADEVCLSGIESRSVCDATKPAR